MTKNDGFFFIPHKWLGDSNVLTMDWDCKGMHLHLMAIAWQQDHKGYLIDDENLIKKLLGNPEQDDWEKRIKKQIFSAWKKKLIKEDGIEKYYWYQPGLLKNLDIEIIKPPLKAKKTRAKKIVDVLENENFEVPLGFDLNSILKLKPQTTILYNKPVEASKEERATIWSLGVSMVKEQSGNDGKARAFLAKLIKEYGEKSVGIAIAQMSLKAINPAEIHSYLIGILKKQQLEEPRRNSRGRVSI